MHTDPVKPFPAVTVCNLNPYKWSEAKKLPNIKNLVLYNSLFHFYIFIVITNTLFQYKALVETSKNKTINSTTDTSEKQILREKRGKKHMQHCKKLF